jgi:hypothetical protein
MGPIGCPETSVATNLLCVTSHKSGGYLHRGGSLKSCQKGKFGSQDATMFRFLARFQAGNVPSLSCYVTVTNAFGAMWRNYSPEGSLNYCCPPPEHSQQDVRVELFVSTYVKWPTHEGGTRWRSWLRPWLNLSGRTMALGSTQPLTEASTRDVSWGKGGRCHLHVSFV